jgi:hypothetical protein
MRDSRFRRLRTWMRPVAVILLLLAASPLTAPFATFDVAPVGSGAPAFDALKSGKTKTANDNALAAPLGRVTKAADYIRSPRQLTDDQPGAARHAHHTILRL